jgi:CubicO group peptidase (beta-lactamase class C family)
MPVRGLPRLLCGLTAAALASTTLGAQSTAAARADAPPASRAALVGRLDSLASAFRSDGPAAGLTVAVVRGTDTLLLRGYGWADSATRRPAGVATVYRIGSITKQFTAAAVLQLVEQRRVALDDTLGRFLPQYPQWGRITVRQLLITPQGFRATPPTPPGACA